MAEIPIEKFIESMNRISPYWTKTVQLVAQAGKIVLVKCEGFSWGSGIANEVIERKEEYEVRKH